MAKLKFQIGIAPLTIVIIIAAVVGTIAIGSALFGGNGEPEGVIDQPDSSGYPSMWAQANLPQYPGATVTKARQGRNLNDGVQVTLEITDDISIVKAYYDAEMANRGFTLPDTPATSYAYFGVYENSGKRFSLTVTKLEDSENFQIHALYSETN